MANETKARLIITFDCPRKCTYCCNSYNRVMAQAERIEDLGALAGLQEVMITGGEPLLYPAKTEAIMWEIRERIPNIKIYLYTALYREAMRDILPLVDGVQYSIHEQATSADFYGLFRFQELIAGYWRTGRSFRLYVDAKAGLQPQCIRRELWDRVEVKSWLTEDEIMAQNKHDGLPEGERLLMYRVSRPLPGALERP